jgi:hypothetical protein
MASKLADDSKYKFRLTELTSESRIMHASIQGFEKEPLVTLEKAVEPLVSIVPQVNHMVWTVKQNYTKPNDDLSLDESASIRLYTLGWKTVQSSFHYMLNKTLRSENRRQLVPWFLYLRLFIFALSKLPTSAYHVFFCSTKTDASQDYLEGRIFIWWDFISCTSSMKFLQKNETRTLFIIECDLAKDISQHSFYETQNEILLYPARQFQTLSSYHSNDQLKIIHLKEIQSSCPLIYIPQISSTTPTLYENERLRIIISKYQIYAEIDLHYQNLTDEDMDIVVKQAIINKKCKELWLQSNKITSTGVSIIAKGLNNNATVEVLILHDNQLCDLGVQSLTKVLSLNNVILKVLGLESTGITDEGAGYLAEMLKTNKTLTSLGLGENDISNRGVQLLANALSQHNNTLQELYLLKNKVVSDLCIDSIIQMLKHNRTLNRLWIDDCNLSSKGKEKLRQTTHTRNRFSLSV